jgi:hypothetical protein
MAPTTNRAQSSPGRRSARLKTSEVAEVLERAVRRMEKELRRRGLLVDESGAEGGADPESNLAASAVSGQAPPAGPQWLRGLQPLEPHALAYDKPLCVSLDGFTRHAATRAGALDQAGREALLRYVLRPPIAGAPRAPLGRVGPHHPSPVHGAPRGRGESAEAVVTRRSQASPRTRSPSADALTLPNATRSRGVSRPRLRRRCGSCSFSDSPRLDGSSSCRGEMREWLNLRDWKSRVPVTPVPRARIPLSPPDQ